MDKNTDPVVTVNEGKLLGTIKIDIHGENFYSFQGIPYAQPPLGTLRFKAPQPPEKWEGIRDAREEGSECFAKNFNTYIGSEDCLFLNVFTKEISRKRLKPVMVWIHGGGFTTGSSKSDFYGPEFLMTEDIVLVTINYRLGPLGFLHLQDTSLGVPGNAGLKDMVMALKWVQKNIRQFSGDPRNVTIFGESAGGAAVHFLMISPMSKGLFHKAIAQSGSAFNGWATSKTHSAYLLAEAIGIHCNDDAMLLEQLQNVPLEQLAKGLEKVLDPFYIGIIRPFGPTIEKKSNEPAFLIEDPLSIIKSGRYHKVPFITGCCSREGMFTYGLCINSKSDTLLKDETIVPHSMHLRKRSSEYDAIKKEIRVCHADDIAYLFKNIFSNEIEPNTKESLGIHRLVKLWTNFAKYGNPTPDEADPLLSVKWKPVSTNKFNVLDIGDNLRMLDEHPEKEALHFGTNYMK